MPKANKRLRPKVSLCMIVKDEEENLPRCLESVKNVVDEIVIVDTGSTDRTPQIAQEYGAKVYFHPWQNNFSLHRNQSISYATGDWILIMDADEELDPISAKNFRKVMASIPPQVRCLRLTVVDKNRNGEPRMAMKSLRMFVNDGSFRYEGFVHNQLIGEGPAAEVDLTIYHYGYDLDEAGLEKKFQRTAGLLHKQLEEDPENLFTLFNLVNIYNMCRRPAGATEYGERLIELLEKTGNFPPVYINAFYATAAAYLNIRNLKRAKEIALKGLSLDPNYVDSLWILTYVSFMEKNFPETIKWGELFLKKLSFYNQQLKVGFKDHLPYKAYLIYSIGKHIHAFLLMALSALKLGDKQRAQQYFDALISHSRTEKNYAQVMKHLVTEGQEIDVDLIDRYVSRALEDFPGDESFWHIKMAVEDARGNFDGVIECLKRLASISGKELWRGKLAEYYLANREPRKAIPLLQDLWLERKLPAYACNLGVAYHQLGQLDKAESWYQEALNTDPFHEESLFNLGQMLFEIGRLDEAQEMFER
ncbi:tetratricopeptide repeat-containing glycosyltransferase family 2 protein, partial [Thermosulfuriphilus sp.]